LSGFNRIMKFHLSEIAKRDFDLPLFVVEVLHDKAVRDEVVKQMVYNPDIMVYYHCFYILETASLKQPSLFYPYWPEFSALLNHSNSYHRDFALILLATLAAVDAENHFMEIEKKYISLINDKKFMTALCCLHNLARIVRARPDLLPSVVMQLLRHEKTSPYTPKQEALFNAGILSLVRQGYLAKTIPPAVVAFIESQLASLSPKTRKQAKDLFNEITDINA
jgi:hypothetical protein